MNSAPRLPILEGQDHSRHATAGHEEYLAGDPVDLAGRDAVFRQVWLGSPLPGLTALIVDGVRVEQFAGPLDLREVLVTQVPATGGIAFVKAHHQKVVGAGGLLTVADLDVHIPGELMGNEMIEWSRRCSGAMGLIACVLDERGTFVRAGDNLIVHDENGTLSLWPTARLECMTSAQIAMSRKRSHMCSQTSSWMTILEPHAVEFDNGSWP